MKDKQIHDLIDSKIKSEIDKWKSQVQKIFDDSILSRDEN